MTFVSTLLKYRSLILFLFFMSFLFLAFDVPLVSYCTNALPSPTGSIGEDSYHLARDWGLVEQLHSLLTLPLDNVNDVVQLQQTLESIKDNQQVSQQQFQELLVEVKKLRELAEKASSKETILQSATRTFVLDSIRALISLATNRGQ